MNRPARASELTPRSLHALHLTLKANAAEYRQGGY